MDPLARFERLIDVARRDTPPAIDVRATVQQQITGSLPAAPRSAARALRRVATWAVAACVVLGAWVWWTRGTQQEASAALARVIDTAQQSQDRTYRIDIHRPPHSDAQGMLYVRGNQRFVLRLPGLFGGEVWLGYNGRQGWLVPGRGPVYVNDDPQALQRWLARRDVSVPLLHVEAILQRAAQRYTLELRHQTLPDGTIQQEIVGRRRAGFSQGPEVIHVWADDQGVATRLVLDWGESARPGRPQKVTLTLESQQALADDWYDHTAHHDPGRTVQPVDLRAGKSDASGEVHRPTSK